ncbi:MAG TPA: penicillin acylase family protein, partial [Bryobacteraceae bacterium]|nr:penicillin acylase family protein [Bryobacteraceae bacterium]
MSIRLCTVALLLTTVASSRAEASGSVTVDKLPGLRQRIEIVLDRDGVPHIRAGNEHDAIFGLGFMHARDRLWQLEYLRRVGSGRLSEVLGPNSVKVDALFRTLGVARSAEATWARYGPKHREFILSYVAGLNAATEQQRRNGLPPEFTILNFEPTPWRPEDVMTIAKVLGWSVDTNWDQELVRLQLEQKLGAVRTAELMPAYTQDGPIIDWQSRKTGTAKSRMHAMPHVDAETLLQLAAFHKDVAQGAGFGGQGIGSNNQVLSGERTVTGSAILASDPHLPSQIPAIFYRAHLTGGALDAIGATAVGIPGFLMGHNGRIAWGWTNANADVQDLYLEKLHGDDQVEYDGVLEGLVIRDEVIKVKGQQDVVLKVRTTRHGPLVSDLVNPNGPALALRWAALDSDDDVGIAASLDANKAVNFAQFHNAYRRHKAHPQNMVYADLQGNIAYHLVGTIPRRIASDGTRPVPGWTSAFEWNGYIPFDDLPALRNPKEGYVATANNKIAPDTYPWVLGSSFAAPYRARRVHELMQEKNRFRLEDLEDMQADVLAVHARDLLPTLLRILPANNMERQALDLLKSWDYRVTPESAAAAVFEAWYIQLAESVFADELSQPLWKAWSEHMHMVSMALSTTVLSDSRWCDDVTTAIPESCSMTISGAFAKALRRMSGVQGSDDVNAWQWSKAHRLVFFHQPFDSDSVHSHRFNRIVPNGGDKHTLNVASNPRWTDYDQRHLALYRQIIDLSDFANSRWMAAPGQSGAATDPHYDDLIAPWQGVKYRRMPFT